MFRLIFLTFFGEPRDHHVHDHAHESPKAMTISLVVLATFAVLGGHVWLTGSLNPHHTWFTHLVDWKTMYPGVDLGGMNQIVVNSHNEHTGHTLALIVSIGVLVLGFTGALWIYGLKRLDPARITGALGEVYVAVKNKYYVDEFVSATVIAGTMWLARAQTWIDENVVDGVVLGVGRVNKALGFVCAWIDKHIVDGAVNWVAHTCQAFGSVIRLFQTGRIQQYVSFAVGGAILVAAFHLLT
jgi:NADH-quinone oxidoreductase subunit L